MSDNERVDSLLIGSGPNGLAAAVTLAQAGRSVLVLEAKDTPGGGARSAALTLPGFVHDICSAIHPLGVASPFFRNLPLTQFGLRWVFPPVSVAHPLDDGTAVLITRSLDETSRQLDEDAAAYRRLMGPHLGSGLSLVDQFLGPLRWPGRMAIPYAWFGMQSLVPAGTLARLAFRGHRARAIFAGFSAHAMMPLSWPGTGGFGLMLGLLTHLVGWPMAQGGSQQIVTALLAYLQRLGGRVQTGRLVRSLDDLPPYNNLLFDLTPRQVVAIAGSALPESYRHTLDRYRYGVGIYKVDYALDGPIPWKAAGCQQAGTVHLGGTLEEIEDSEAAVWRGEAHERPYVLLAQQSLFDSTRAPQGKHTAWAYCHAPRGFSGSMLDQIENQIERFAPGFRSRILARKTTNAVEMEQYNANYIGGDINGGVQDLAQFFTRPAPRLDPYRIPAQHKNWYICSSSTPPGGGVHGMCGYYAAKSALRNGRSEPGL